MPLQKSRQSFMQKENRISDQNIVDRCIADVYTDIPKEQHPIGFYEAIRNNYGALINPPLIKNMRKKFFETI